MSRWSWLVLQVAAVAVGIWLGVVVVRLVTT